MNLESQIESILFFKNEPVSIKELAMMLGTGEDSVKSALESLEDSYKDRGIVLVTDGSTVCFGTSPANSELIEKIQKDELSRELGRAGLETLAVVLYKGPVSRREIDYIRGVNSGYILRTLLIRGLIVRVDSNEGRGYSYKSTLKLLEHLGITKPQDLPDYSKALTDLEEFSKTKNESDS